jgi:hypothetical protein
VNLGRGRGCATALALGAAFALHAAGPPGTASPTVAILPSGAEFRLEIAADPETQRRGYMFRERVPADEGMLFVYREAGRRSFWMKNCKVPLDIVWLDDASRVVEIAHSLPPCPASGPCPSVEPQRWARHVLELAGGTATREGLSIGDLVTIVPEPVVP